IQRFDPAADRNYNINAFRSQFFSGARAITRLRRILFAVLGALLLFVAIGPLLIAAVIEGWWPSETPGTVYDEAQTAGRPAKSLAPRQETYFAEMDAGVALSPEEAI